MPIRHHNDKKGKHQSFEAHFTGYKPMGHPDAYGGIEATGFGATQEEATQNLRAYLLVLCSEALKEVEVPTLSSLMVSAIQTGSLLRPTSWRGSGAALMVEGDNLFVVPQGSKPVAYVPKVQELTCQWELATFDEIATEIDILIDTHTPDTE